MITEDLPRIFEPQPVHPLVARRSAMLTIDVQRGQVFSLANKVRDAGLHDIATAYDSAVQAILPRIRMLQDRCRARHIEVIHLRFGSFSGTGSDCSQPFRRSGHEAAAWDCSDQIIDAAVAPHPGEIVMNKVSSGAFNGSDLDALLRRLGIDTLIVTGLVTASCVESTIRGAADCGYNVFVASDACADWTDQQHELSLAILGRWFATVLEAERILRLIAGVESDHA
jgi:biuret amidohydrolase